MTDNNITIQKIEADCAIVFPGGTTLYVRPTVYTRPLPDREILRAYCDFMDWFEALPPPSKDLDSCDQ